jgi:hypothetical protein
MQSIPIPGSGLQLAVLPFSSVPMHRRVLMEVVFFVTAELKKQLHKQGWDIRKLKLQRTFGGKPSCGPAPYNVFRDGKNPHNFVIVCPASRMRGARSEQPGRTDKGGLGR